MKKKLIFELIILALFTSVILAGPTFAADPVVTWKVQIPFSPGFWQFKASQMWADDIFNMSGGRMKVELFHPVYDLYPEVLSTVQSGQRDAGYTWLGWAWGHPIPAQKYPAATLFAGTPAFFDLLGYFTWLYSYGGKELLQETFGNALVVFPAGMFWAKCGGWANKKFENLTDLKGIKYRTDDPVWGKILSKIGASPVSRPHPRETRDDIQGGLIDALEFSTPWQDMVLSIHKFTKYSYFPGLQQIAGFLMLFVNNQKWEALPPDLKEIVKGACDAATARSLTNWLLDDAKAVKLLKDQGKVNIVKFSKEMQQEILDKFVAQYDAVTDPMFQKVWKSQKEFMKIYVPYMKLQQVDAEVKLK
jgi:TRAP-type mannitol/chloroaromatic compound transport system substrate-binding protein